MKNIIYIPIIILATLLFCQCNTKRNTKITIKNTAVTDTLTGRSVSVNEDLLMPVKVFAMDDKLVVFDRVNSDFFKVFKTPEMELLYSFGSKGRGPNEFSHIDPNSMKVVGNKIWVLCGIEWIIEFKFTSDEVNHVDEIINIPISPGSSFGQLNLTVNPFHDAVGYLRFQVVDNA